MYNWLVYNRFHNLNKEECSICNIQKNLEYFCKNHKFCLSCSKQWIFESSECPLCRELCNNSKIMPFNIEIVNLNLNKIQINYFINQWHKKFCIKKKHKLIISYYKNKNKNIFIKIYCENCNIEQKMYYGQFTE